MADKTKLERILAVAGKASLCERIAVRRWTGGFHMTIDGRDIATVNGTSFGLCTENLLEAEKALSVSPA